MNKLFSLIFILITANLFCLDLSNIDPTFYSYSARAIAMGNAYCAESGEPALVFWNPAGVKTDSHLSFSFSSTTFLDLISYNYVGVSKKMNSDLTLAGNMIFSGDEAYQEYAFYLSIAVDNSRMMRLFPTKIRENKVLENFVWGINVKYLGASFGNNSNGALIDDEGLNHQVSGSANGFGIDLGVQTSITRFSNLGILWRNPLNRIYWHSENEVGTALGNYQEGQPSQLVLGYKYKRDKIALNFDLSKSYNSDTEDNISTGLEYLFLDIAPLRSGYSQELMTGENRKYSFGCGYNFNIWNNRKFRFDLAYEIQTEWDGSNSLVISGLLF